MRRTDSIACPDLDRIEELLTHAACVGPPVGRGGMTPSSRPLEEWTATSAGAECLRTHAAAP